MSAAVHDEPRVQFDAGGAALAANGSEVVMAIATGTATAVDTMRERFAPALDTVEETIRQGRRALVRGQHAAEDAAAAATLVVRRRPLSAVMLAAGAGALAGGLIGFGIGWFGRCRK
jgi:ElaB/YqjD/DUF883 family membrane-anchored ribosome-binding protein